MSYTNGTAEKVSSYNFLEDNRFWLILLRNKKRTILIDLPNLWARITVSKYGNVYTSVARSVEETGVSPDVFTKAEKSRNLKMALSEVTRNFRIKRAFVVRNKYLKQDDNEG